MVWMEHLRTILFSDGLHGIAHLFYMSESPRVARTHGTHLQRRRWHALTLKTLRRVSLYKNYYVGWTLEIPGQDQEAAVLTF